MNVKLTFAAALIALVSLVCGAPAFAQDYTSGSSYRPTTFGNPEAPSVRFMDHRSTELGDALDGLSLVIEAQGRFERARSEAIVNLQQAERLRLENLIERERTKLAVQKQRLELQALKNERVRLTRQISLETQARMKPAVVISRNGSIQWIEPLKAPEFAAHRQTIEKSVSKLFAARSLADRQELLDQVNFDCQELIETLDAHKANLAPNVYDASRRFAIRLYDDLQNPEVVAATTLTLR